jgi:hypothetical protein
MRTLFMIIVLLNAAFIIVATILLTRHPSTPVICHEARSFVPIDGIFLDLGSVALCGHNITLTPNGPVL